MRQNKQEFINKLSKSICESVSTILDGYFGQELNDYPNELERLNKETFEHNDGVIEVVYHFGKNGGGITKELIAIGQDIYKLSQKYYINMQKSFIDTPDDVYDIAIIGTPWKGDEYVPTIRKKHNVHINEGAWGFTPRDSDWYWDKTHDLTDKLKKDFLKGLKSKDTDTKYVYLGLVNGFLSADDIWNESIQSCGYNYELYKAFKKAYEDVKNDDDYVYSWSDSKVFLKELDKSFDKFKKYLTDKYQCSIAEIPEGMEDQFDDHICNLKPGTYKGWFYAHVFELENGKKYYTAIGVRHGKKCAKLQEYEVRYGRLIEKNPIMCDVANDICSGNEEAIENEPKEPNYAVNDKGQKLSMKDVPDNVKDDVVGTINDLKNGIYVAKHYNCYFKLKDTGEQYYIDYGPRCYEKQVQWMRYKVKDGKIQKLAKAEEE